MSLFPATDLDHARRYDAWFEAGWGRHAWSVESTALLRALGPARRVVEAGCGTGRLLALLRAEGREPLGVDLDRGLLAVAAERAPGRLVRADAHRLPLTDAAADAAVALATLELTHDPAAVLAELARVVRPGGRVVVGALSPRSPWGVLDRPRGRPPYRDARFLSRTSLRQLGSRHGRARVDTVLFGARRLPPWSLGLLERVGPHLLPRWGALHVLVVDVPA